DLLGDEGAAAVPLQQTLDIAAICLANEMVGGAERLRESAVEYANMRVQFGRAIGSFQSLKHKAADMLLDVELAKSAAYYAAAAADEDDEEISALASLAKAAAADAYMQTAIHTVQIHGGIGFTWDNDTHLWFKRAKSSEVFLGDAAYHRERLMQQWNV
ncbi:MAG: acyl-CoA dehydrogenase family protein, partial [Rickettsiales bacterium]